MLVQAACAIVDICQRWMLADRLAQLAERGVACQVEAAKQSRPANREGLRKHACCVFSSSGLKPLGSLRCAQRPKPPVGGFVEQGSGLIPFRQQKGPARGPLCWRTGRDSNPRNGSAPFTHFPGVRLQPLGHLSTAPGVIGFAAQSKPTTAPARRRAGHATPSRR